MRLRSAKSLEILLHSTLMIHMKLWLIWVGMMVSYVLTHKRMLLSPQKRRTVKWTHLYASKLTLLLKRRKLRRKKPQWFHRVITTVPMELISLIIQPTIVLIITRTTQTILPVVIITPITITATLLSILQRLKMRSALATIVRRTESAARKLL